jgi:hypothetical protein
MPRNRPFAFEFRSDNKSAVVRVVVTFDLDNRVVETGLDELGYFYWVHNMQAKRSCRAESGDRLSGGAQCNR